MCFLRFKVLTFFSIRTDNPQILFIFISLTLIKINEENFSQLIKGSKGGSLNNNPRDVSDEDLIELLYKITGLC